MNDVAIKKAHARFGERVFKKNRRFTKRPSEREIIEMEREQVDRELRQLRADFYTRQGARCSAA